MNEQHSESTATPVAGTERIASLDVLRGVAILGILVMNIYAFAMPFPAYNNPLLMGGSDTLNIGTWFFTHILFDQKFMSIFAMLFGAGIILMTGRAEAKGAKYGRIFYRRQLWLVVLGALHAYLFWFGDILFLYAVVGMLAYLFRNRRPRTLIVIACVLLPVVVLMSYGTGFSMQKLQSKAAQVHVLVEAGDEVSEEQQAVLDKWDEQRPMMAPDAETIQQDVVTHLGSYFDIAAERIPLAMMMQVFMVAFFGWRVLALMLLGMALMKTGVLSAQRTSSFYRNMMLICYGLGLPLTIYSAVDLYAHEFVALYVFKVGGIANYFGSILVGLGHIALLMLLLRGGYVQQLLQRFAAVGRMALSNYLMHSVLLTTVFYGYGLGLYGSVSRFGQMGFVLGVIALQLVLSPWWLARYRFGPVEWLWRSLTYWKRQPMLR
jgi:uncharacterized protein